MKRSILLPVVAMFCTGAAAATARPGASGLSPGPQMNPGISVVIDGVFYRGFGDEPLDHILEELSGFGHGHDDCDHDHDHEHGLEEGFNLRHLEITFAADVDPYFRAWATVAVEDHEAELEEAVVQTTMLPGGLGIKGGKFFSDFSRQNAMHAHDWSFTDMPLINHLLLGDHGLNEKGIQLSWLAPTPFYLSLGAEALQGQNEAIFTHIADEDDPLPERAGPRLGVAWAKLAPSLHGSHAFQLGMMFARGVHQEAHDLDDPERSHWLDGHQTLMGADFVYRYTPGTSYGQNWLTVEGGYLYREKNIELIEHNWPGAEPFIGNSLVSKQDGFYLQGVYGFLPRWRLGLRGEMVGLINEQTKPSGAHEDFDSSYRASGMVDFTLTEYSRLRFQVNHGAYETEDGLERATEVLFQGVFTLGAHGAHTF